MSDEKRFSLDRSINITTVISVLMLAGTGAGVYSTIDKRIAVLEANAISATTRSTEQQIEQKESIKEIKIDIKDIQRSLNEISRSIAGKR